VTGPGLRERKKADTHAALAAATLRLAGERGWPAVTVEQIAAEAGVSYRTFFNHFSSKEEALLRPRAEEPGRFGRLLAEQDPALPALAASRAVLRSELAPVDDDPAGWRLRLSVIAGDPLLLARAVEVGTANEREMAAALAARTGLDPDRDLYPALLAGVLGAAVRVTLTRWRCGGGTTPLPDLFDAAVDQLATGLRDPSLDA
jgi:AcrR family transcriptional regulator